MGNWYAVAVVTVAQDKSGVSVCSLVLEAENVRQAEQLGVQALSSLEHLSDEWQVLARACQIRARVDFEAHHSLGLFGPDETGIYHLGGVGGSRGE